MKQLLMAMFMSVLICVPLVGQSTPRAIEGVSKPGRAVPASARRGAGNPGRAAPASTRRGAGNPGRAGSTRRGVGAPGVGKTRRPAAGVARRPVVVAPRRAVVVAPRSYGHHYHGYGHYDSNDDAWKFLAFTAITLKILDNMNEAAQREHEAAQVKATTAPVGEKIAWDTSDASGYVVTTKTGTGSSGLQCREFQQEITVGGEKEQAYGTACLQEDGSWKITQ